MKKTIIVAIIAIVLVISIAGTCVALYKVAATQKQVSISAIDGGTVTLTINNTGDLDFSGISPVNRTKTFQLQLTTNNADLVDGVHGIFKVAVSGDLADYITLTVNNLTAIDAEPGEVNADAITANGADIALSATPKYFKVTMYLNDSGVTNFATIAESTGTVTVTWAVNNNSVFSYDANAYYAVGVINGVTAWYACSDSIKLDSEVAGENVAQKNAVTLHNGDVFKVVHGESWYGGKTENNNVEGVSVSGNDGNISITKDGTYYIFVNGSGQVWVDTHA